MKGVIYYTDNRLKLLKKDHMLEGLVQDSILASGLPITSCSLEPIDFGENIVLELEPSVVTMYEQMYAAMKASKQKYIFFCEHDVIYHPSHFDFTPERDDTFYYNTHAWRCNPKRDVCVTYDKLRSVSGICANREMAVDHYKKRLEHIYKNKFDECKDRNPRWARRMGFEPGKKVKSGGFTENRIEDWRSKHPNIDVRHRLNITTPQENLKDFNYKPTNFKKVGIDEITSWNLREMFNVK